MMDCKRALLEAGGDFAKAKQIATTNAGGKVSKLADRAAKEGRLAVFPVVENPADLTNSGVIVELTCNTDFTGKNEAFVKLAQGIAQTAAQDPKRTTDAAALSTMAYAPNPAQTVQQVIAELIAQTGENMALGRIRRLDVEKGRVFPFYYGGSANRLGVLVAFHSDHEEDYENPGLLDVLKALAAQLVHEVNDAHSRGLPTPTFTYKSRHDVPHNLIAAKEAELREAAKTDTRVAGKGHTAQEGFVKSGVNAWLGDIGVFYERPSVQYPGLSVGHGLGRLAKQSGVKVKFDGYTALHFGHTDETKAPDAAAAPDAPPQA